LNSGREDSSRKKKKVKSSRKITVAVSKLKAAVAGGGKGKLRKVERPKINRRDGPSREEKKP